MATTLALTLNAILTPSAHATVTPVSYWRLGENDPGVAAGPATNTTDPTGGRTVTLSNAPSYSASVSASADARTGSDWCLAFNGGNFGLELWVNPNNTTSNQYLAYNGSTANSGWGLYQAGAKFEGFVGGLTFIGSGPATAGTWTHLALVRNNGLTTFYLNGVAAGSSLTAPIAPAGIFGVAADPQNNASERFSGSLDEVRVFTFTAGAFSTNDLLITPQPPMVTLLPPGVAGATVTLNGATNTLAATNATLAITSFLTGLPPVTTYHFELVAANSAGIGFGGDLTFTTGRLPITNVITLLADSGPGSLRAAILNSIPGDVITLATNGTITLTSGELLITNNLTIHGPGATNLSISGNETSRIVELAAAF